MDIRVGFDVIVAGVGRCGRPSDCVAGLGVNLGTLRAWGAAPDIVTDFEGAGVHGAELFAGLLTLAGLESWQGVSG